MSLMQSLLESVQKQPAGTVATTAAAGLLGLVGLGMLLSALQQRLQWWGISWRLRQVWTPRWSLPYLGHALLLAASPPWDVMHGWITESGQRLVKMNFLGKVGRLG